MSSFFCVTYPVMVLLRKWAFVLCRLEDRPLFAMWKGLTFGKWKNEHRGVCDVWLWWKTTGCFVLLAATEVALESVNVMLWFYPSICRTA